jgi:hypothetical protein
MTSVASAGTSGTMGTIAETLSGVATGLQQGQQSAKSGGESAGVQLSSSSSSLEMASTYDDRKHDDNVISAVHDTLEAMQGINMSAMNNQMGINVPVTEDNDRDSEEQRG